MRPQRRSVRPRTVCADLKWLRQVIGWATTWQERTTGAYLMREDPTRGWKLPQNGDARRPVATTERYMSTREAAENLIVRVIQGGVERHMPSYLPELLDLAFATGRRIGAITQLRYRDLRLDAPRPTALPKPARWYGAIAWPADTDKKGKAWSAPIDGIARATLDRVLKQRPAFNPDAPLFPALEDPAQPIRVDVVRRWLLQAEKLAGLPKLDGSLWHAYRRLWATARKDLPVQDVAAAGGWKDLKTLMTCYQHADEETTYKVVMHGARASGI